MSQRINNASNESSLLMRADADAVDWPALVARCKADSQFRLRQFRPLLAELSVDARYRRDGRVLLYVLISAERYKLLDETERYTSLGALIKACVGAVRHVSGIEPYVAVYTLSRDTRLQCFAPADACYSNAPCLTRNMCALRA